MKSERILQLHPRDDVAVAPAGVEAGTQVRVGASELTARERIRPAHKVALRRIEAGEAVYKYGSRIGIARATIKPGEWVHTHNLGSGLAGLGRYELGSTYARSASAKPEPCKGTFLGYPRPDGRVGIRNELWIVPTVGCANGMARTIAAAFGDRLPPSVEAIRVLSHPYGCSQSGKDHLRTQRMLAAMTAHPNAAGVLVLSLGCEDNGLPEFRPLVERMNPDPQRCVFLKAQDEGKEVESGVEALHRLAAYAAEFTRQPALLSHLAVGMKCGGSDAFSGITANPLTGAIADRLYAHDAATVLTEVPEMFGAEQQLLDRCIDERVFSRATAMLDRFRRMFIDSGQPIYDNPSAGNREGGITTLEEKSLGCVQKGGMQPITDVLDYGQQVREPGLSLAEGPGNDLVSVSVLAATGVQMILFTTGRGTPLGSPVPVIKLASNSELAGRKPHWIDFDAGVLMRGASMEGESERLWQLIVQVAGGRRTRSESNGYHEFLPFKDGTTK